MSKNINPFISLLGMAVEETLKSFEERIKNSEKPMRETINDMFSDIISNNADTVNELRQKYNELCDKAKSVITSKTNEYNELKHKFDCIREQLRSHNKLEDDLRMEIKGLETKNKELIDLIDELTRKYENADCEDGKSVCGNVEVFAPITYYVVSNFAQASIAIEKLNETYGRSKCSHDKIFATLKLMFEKGQDACIYLNKYYDLCCCVATGNAPRSYLTKKELPIDCETPVEKMNYEEGDDDCNDDCNDSCENGCGCGSEAPCEESCKCNDKKRIPDMLKKLERDEDGEQPYTPKRKRIVIK